MRWLLPITMAIMVVVAVLFGASRLGQAQVQAQQVQQQLQDVTQQLDTCQYQIAQTRAATETLQGEIEQITARIDDGEAELHQTQEQIALYKQQLHELAAEDRPLRDGFALHRETLQPQEQRLYDALRAAVLRGDYKVDVTQYQMGMNQISNVYFVMLYDNPDIFWMNGTVTGYYQSTKATIDSVEMGSNYSTKARQEAEAQFLEAALPVVEEALTLADDLARIRFIHNHLADTVQYETGDGTGTAYSAIVGKRALCEGYAMAFNYYMGMLGIPSGYCTGVAGGEAHGWNLVLLDGDYYNVDVTWDDPLGYGPGQWDYDYFLISDSKIAQTHTRDERGQLLPACTSTRFDAQAW